VNEPLEVLEDVVDRLRRARVPYMISGSVAMNHYAVPRMTRDLDLVVELSPEDAARFESAFGGDYYLDSGAVKRAIDHRGMFNAIHLEHVFKVDFIVRKDSEYRRLEFSRRRETEVEGVSLSIVRPEDLLLSKLDWARDSRSETQLHDIRNLIAAVPGLDWTYVRTWAGHLGLTVLMEEVTE